MAGEGEGSTGTQDNPGGMSASESADFFGIRDAGGGTDDGGKTKGPDGATGEQPGDKSKPGDSANAAQGDAEKMLAGKFKNPEALEMAYLELEKKYTNASHGKRQNDELLSRIDRLEASLRQKGDGDREKDDAGFFSKGNSTADPVVARLEKARDKMAEQIGQEAADAWFEAQKSVHEEYTTRITRESNLRQADEIARIETDFAKDNPGYNDPDIQASLKELREEYPNKARDPRYLLQVEYEIAKSRNLPKIVDVMVTKRLNAAVEKEIAKRISAGLLTSSSGGMGDGSGGTDAAANLKARDDYWGLKEGQPRL